MKAQLEIIDSMVFSKMKNYILNDVGSKYNMTDANFSSVKEPTGSTFPFVFMTLLNGTEMATDLEADTLNGALYTYQINVYDNESQYRAKEVMSSVSKAMKSMMFKNTSLPIAMDNSTTHILISRFQRDIENGDEI